MTTLRWLPSLLADPRRSTDLLQVLELDRADVLDHVELVGTGQSTTADVFEGVPMPRHVEVRFLAAEDVAVVLQGLGLTVHEQAIEGHRSLRVIPEKGGVIEWLNLHLDPPSEWARIIAPADRCGGAPSDGPRSAKLSTYAIKATIVVATSNVVESQILWSVKVTPNLSALRSNPIISTLSFAGPDVCLLVALSFASISRIRAMTH
jgi:hypothetical protein